MTALVYEKFMEFDENKSYLNQQEEEHGDNPFAALGGFLAKALLFSKIKII